MRTAYQYLISFVWLWETSRELAQKKVEFLQNYANDLQTTVKHLLNIETYSAGREERRGG